MKIHDEIEDWMAGALCDALTPDEQKNFEQHLAQCPHCRSLYVENHKLNDLLNQTLPDLRPDQNFERRVIAAFREKIARGSFHPLRGLVWFVQFRTVRTALALLLLAAMVKGGSSMISGERFAGGKAYNVQDYARMQANTKILADKALNLVTGQIRQGSTGANGVFNGSASDTRTIPGTLGTLDLSGNNVTVSDLSPKGPAVGYNAQVFSGKASWGNGKDTNWTTGANWADGQAGGLDNMVTVNDAATFRDVAGKASRSDIALGGNQTWTVNSGTASALTVNGALTGGHSLASAGSVTFGGGVLQYRGANTTDYGHADQFPLAAKDTHEISIDTNGQSVTYARNLAASNKGGLTLNGGALTNRITTGASRDVTNTVSGTGTITGAVGITKVELAAARWCFPVPTPTPAPPRLITASWLWGAQASYSVVANRVVNSSNVGTAFTGTIASTGVSTGDDSYARDKVA